MSSHPELSLTLYKERSEIASPIIAVLATLLGFLAAFVSLLFGLNDNKFSREYKRNGSLDVFIFYYYFSLMLLVMGIIVGLINFSHASGVVAFRLMLILSSASIFSVCVVSFSIINVMKNASGEDPKPSGKKIKGPTLVSEDNLY